MTTWIILTSVALLVTWLGYWFWRHNRLRTTLRGHASAAGYAGGAEAAGQAAVNKDIAFRPTTAPGVSPVCGDLMCADGVYLPGVKESDYQASYDGRWIRTGSHGNTGARLVDRKTRQSWALATSEVEALESIHWRLPRWDGEELNESGLADDAHTVFSDVRFTAWLNTNVQSAPVELVQIRDLWVPWDCAGKPQESLTINLPPCPTGDTSLTAERHWPQSLRTEDNPLQVFSEPLWHLYINDKPQPWIVDASLPIVWRPDGQALALYAWPEVNGVRQSRLTLAIWSRAHGWQKWQDHQPADNKSWRVVPSMPPPARSGSDDIRDGSAPAPAATSPDTPLRWWNGKLLQRMQADVPRLEHLHDGAGITPVDTGPVPIAAAHNPAGRMRLQPVPRTKFMWQRDIDKPEQWQALSELVGNYPMIWTLHQKAGDGAGSTPSYRLHWGNTSIPGLWELEHIIVQRRWAILLRHPLDDGQEANTQLYTWDGKDLKAMDLPWQVVRMFSMPAPTGGKSLRVRLVALTGTVPTDDAKPHLPGWQWPLSAPKPELLEQASNYPFYETRDIVPDAQGVWQLRPRWREVSTIQHPCADGDYVWRSRTEGDELWWWGGLQENLSNEWDVHNPRIEGVCMTKGGTVLCGIGPCITPDPEGEGWAILECPRPPAASAHQDAADEPSPWKVHWLQPRKRQVRTIALDAKRPVLKGWDAKGLHWYDEGRTAAKPAATGQEDTAAVPPTTAPAGGTTSGIAAATGAGAASTESPAASDTPAATGRYPIETIVQTQWARAAVQDLKQGPYGLWMRKQDMRFADAIRRRDDPPWDMKGKW